MERNTLQSETLETIQKPLKKFNIAASFTFLANLEIHAENKMEAIRIFKDSISVTLPEFDSYLPDSIFPTHNIEGNPTKKACKITLI